MENNVVSMSSAHEYDDSPVIFARYDLFNDEHIADFFNRNGLNLVSIPEDCRPEHAEHIGKYVLGHAGFFMDGPFFDDPRSAFHYVISHQFVVMGWLSFITNHLYHETYEKGSDSSAESES